MKRRTIIQSLFALLCVATSLQAELAPPAGVIRIDLPAGQDVLASMPFETDSAAIQDVLSNADLTEGCQIFKWNAASQSYRSATLVQGIWSSHASGDTPSEMTLDGGEGFIIRNPGETDQHLFMVGTARIDEQVTIPLYPGLSVIATPYSADLMGTANALRPETLTPPAKHILMGRAYWHHNIHQATTFWTVTPPYDLTFTPAAIPAITDITVNDGAAALSIATHGNSAEQIDIFYRDIDHTGAHLNPGDWTLAATLLLERAEATLQWIDSGSTERASLDQVAGRYYAVAIAPSTENAIISGLEHRRQPNDAIASTPSTPATSRLEYDLKTIYVNGRTGSDVVTKRKDVPSGAKANPKRTIDAAIKIASTGDTIMVMAGNYHEGLRLPDGVKMRFSGKVQFR